MPVQSMTSSIKLPPTTFSSQEQFSSLSCTHTFTTLLMMARAYQDSAAAADAQYIIKTPLCSSIWNRLIPDFLGELATAQD